MSRGRDTKRTAGATAAPAVLFLEVGVGSVLAFVALASPGLAVSSVFFGAFWATGLPFNGLIRAMSADPEFLAPLAFVGGSNARTLPLLFCGETWPRSLRVRLVIGGLCFGFSADLGGFARLRKPAAGVGRFGEDEGTVYSMREREGSVLRWNMKKPPTNLVDGGYCKCLAAGVGRLDWTCERSSSCRVGKWSMVLQRATGGGSTAFSLAGPTRTVGVFRRMPGIELSLRRLC